MLDILELKDARPPASSHLHLQSGGLQSEVGNREDYNNNNLDSGLTSVFSYPSMYDELKGNLYHAESSGGNLLEVEVRDGKVVDVLGPAVGPFGGV